MWPRHLEGVATLPWEIQKNRFSSILRIYTPDYLHYLRIKRTVTVIVNWPITPENVTALPCEMQNLFV